MVTDGSKTFVFFHYPEDGIQLGARAQIGLDSGLLRSTVSNFMHPAALTNNSLTVESTTNTGINGKWAFHIDTPVQLQPGGKTSLIPVQVNHALMYRESQFASLAFGIYTYCHT